MFIYFIFATQPNPKNIEFNLLVIGIIRYTQYGSRRLIHFITVQFNGV